MKDAVKFRWEGFEDNEGGFAFYEVGLSTYSLLLPHLRTARLVHTALSDVYQQGYERGVHSTKLAVQSALLKIKAED